MTVDERYKYLRVMHRRYRAANRRGKTQLLNEAQAVTQQNRKYLIGLLNHPGPIRKARQGQRGVQYGPEVTRVVGVVAEALDWICAERLQPALAPTARHLARLGGLTLTEEVAQQLETMSVSTLRRRLKHLCQDQPRLPQHQGRGHPSGLAAEIPATRIP